MFCLGGGMSGSASMMGIPGLDEVSSCDSLQELYQLRSYLP